MINVDNMLQRLEEFPTLPTIYTKLTNVMSNPRATASDVAEIISKDQSAASKVLKVANSSFYGFRGKINNITQSIIYLGFEEIKNLVVALSIIDIFDENDEDEILTPMNLWKHSIAVGVLSRIIGKQIKSPDLENYFLAGVLHDIGKLFLFKYFKKEYVEVAKHSLDNKTTLWASEKKLLGITHTVLGELIAERWKLPLNIRQAISGHHSPLVETNYDSLTMCVHLSNIIALLTGRGIIPQQMVHRPNTDLWEHLDIPDGFFTSNYAKIRVEIDESVNLLMKFK